jgi:hypothetical protein
MSDEFLFDLIFDLSACDSEDDDFERNKYSVSMNKSERD